MATMTLQETFIRLLTHPFDSMVAYILPATLFGLAGIGLWMNRKKRQK